jgi:hypothetical protein
MYGKLRVVSSGVTQQYSNLGKANKSPAGVKLGIVSVNHAN